MIKGTRELLDFNFQVIEEKGMPDIFEIDKLQTERINFALESHRCECSDCQRYYRFMEQLPPSAREFFVVSGIDPVKCQELWAYFPNDNGFTYYSGYFYIAIKKAKALKPFNISKDWKTLDYGICCFRIRLEYTTDGKSILGFEASLPIEKPLPTIPK